MVEYHIQQKCGIKCLRNGDYMKKLFEQIVKFGIVGAIAFVIDYPCFLCWFSSYIWINHCGNDFLYGIRYF